MAGPPLEFDHLVIAAETLEAGEAWLAERLKAAPEPGGKHGFMGTHNRVWRLGAREYIELIAIDPEAAAPDRPRWFGLDSFSGLPRLVAWVCRTGNLKPPEGATVTDAARGDLRWRIAIPDSGVSGSDGLEPLRIAWGDGPHPADAMPDHGLRLIGLDLDHPAPPRLNIKDPRVRISRADEPRLVAHISTPQGKVTL
ncbi:VOC family protein [Paracoccus sediminicola]|uniref:VOC family protein n=1 Tax=Paracoccus sediminicola TaxID=3017783 RepID=UPI0022F12FE1|nr:VOC family protein [Paracoccus sediminicola]WBU58296.1 VOC family protein [Paracoccus sediminicola]